MNVDGRRIECRILKSFLLLMDDRPNRGRPVASQLFVLQKGELHPAAAKKMSGLKGVRKTKTAP